MQNGDLWGFTAEKKGISAHSFLAKVPIFAIRAGKTAIQGNILPPPALNLFQFIGLCKKQ